MPWLYLKGVSRGEMSEALKVLIGADAKGLLATTVSRLKQMWGQEYQSWREVLLKLNSLGMNGPELTIGDGAMGFWRR